MKTGKASVYNPSRMEVKLISALAGVSRTGWIITVGAWLTVSSFPPSSDGLVGQPPWSRKCIHRMREMYTISAASMLAGIVVWGNLMTCVFHVHLLRCIYKVFVLLAPLLDVEGVGANEEEVLHVFECGL